MYSGHPGARFWDLGPAIARTKSDSQRWGIGRIGQCPRRQVCQPTFGAPGPDFRTWDRSSAPAANLAQPGVDGVIARLCNAPRRPTASHCGYIAPWVDHTSGKFSNRKGRHIETSYDHRNSAHHRRHRRIRLWRFPLHPPPSGCKCRPTSHLPPAAQNHPHPAYSQRYRPGRRHRPGSSSQQELSPPPSLAVPDHMAKPRSGSKRTANISAVRQGTVVLNRRSHTAPCFLFPAPCSLPRDPSWSDPKK
jgi:hypothetical protein